MDPQPPLHQGERPPDNRRRIGRRTSDRMHAHLAAMVECADDAIIGTTVDGEIRSWNRAAERLFGYKADEIIGQRLSLLIPPEAEEKARSTLEFIRRIGAVDHYETVRTRKDGGRVFVALTVSPVRNDQGRVVGISEIARDITGSRLAEQRLRESEARNRALFESSRDGILLLDMNGRFTDANPAAAEMLGYSPAELQQMTYQQLTNPSCHEKERAIVQEQILPRGYSDVYDTEYICKDGTRAPVSVRAWLRTDHEGQPMGTWVLVRDMAEQRRAERIARDSEARWRSLFENAPVPIWEEDFSAIRARFDELRSQGVTDLAGYLDEHPEETGHLAGLMRLLDMSRATLETFKVSSLQELSCSLANFFDEEALSVVREKMVALWSGQRHFVSEIPIRDTTGQRRLLDVRLSVVPGFEESLARVLISFMDITERRRAEAALRESEARYRTLAEGIPHILWETDARGAVLYYNRTWYEYVGRRPEESYNREWYKDFHPQDRDRLFTEWARSIRGKGAHTYDTEVRIRRHDGVYRWFRINGAPVRNHAGKIVRWVGICADIDDQKRAAERLELAQKAGKVGFYEYDFAANQVLWAEGTAELFGIDPKNTPQATDVWRKLVVPEDAAAIAGKVTECINARAEHVDYEFRAILPDGTHRWLGGRGQIVYDSAGAPVRMIGMNVDISERKRLEKELEERAHQLANADRRKDEFLATLAHELRNPLAPIRTSVDIIRMKAGDNARVHWAADTIARQLQHLNHLVSDLLDLARVAQGKVSLMREPCDLKQLVQRAIEMNREGIQTKHQHLRVDLPKEALPLEGDTARLVQVFSNLMSNAVKYTPANGSIHVFGERDNGTVALHVRDSGIGIDPELLPYVFDLFVQGERTIARAEGGLGIGLTLVKRITELHHGSVEVHSAGHGQGAEFIVRLPLAAIHVPAAPPPAEADAYRVTDAPKRILIVEDNRDAADSLAFLLGDLGHDVHAAYDGPEGLQQVLALHPDIVILDIGLPGLSGYEVARRIRAEAEARQTLLIAMSGYGQQADREASRAAGFDFHLVKPFDVPELNAILSATGAHA